MTCWDINVFEPRSAESSSTRFRKRRDLFAIARRAVPCSRPDSPGKTGKEPRRKLLRQKVHERFSTLACCCPRDAEPRGFGLLGRGPQGRALSRSAAAKNVAGDFSLGEGVGRRDGREGGHNFACAALNKTNRAFFPKKRTDVLAFSAPANRRSQTGPRTPQGSGTASPRTKNPTVVSQETVGAGKF